MTDNICLRRNYLSGFELAFQSVGTVAPTACMALLLPVIFGASGTGTWLTLLFAGAGILLLALQMNVFGRRMASPGATYAFVQAGLGPIAGTFAGWAALAAYVLFIATIPPQLANLIAIMLHERGFDLEMSGRMILIVLSAILPWYLARQDIKLSARVTSVIEIATMALLFYLLAIRFTTGGGELVDKRQLDLSGFSFSQFHLGLVLAFLCYGGFESAMELGAEARRPFVMIPRMLIIVVCLLIGFFVLTGYGTEAAFEGIVPTLDHQESPMAALADAVGYGWLGKLITAGIMVSLMASLLGAINAAARVLYAFSHRGLFFRGIGVIHPVHATPARAIAVVTLLGLGIAMGLTATGIDPLDQLGDIGAISSIAILVSYLMVSVAAPVYLYRHGQLKPWNVVTAILSAAMILVPLAGTLYPVPDFPVNLMPYGFLALMAAGMGWLLYVRKRHPERLAGVESEMVTQSP
jgi:amino acid transporter